MKWIKRLEERKDQFFKRVSDYFEDLKLKTRNYLLSFDIIHYFWFKGDNLKNFKRISSQNSKIAIDALLEGVGGSKNLIEVKNTVYSVEIFFKSKYLLKEDLIFECGGLGIVIGDKSIFAVFDWQEAGNIAKAIKSEMINSKRKYVPLDID